MEKKNKEFCSEFDSAEVVKEIIRKLPFEIRVTIDPSVDTPIKHAAQKTNKWLAMLDSNIKALHNQISNQKPRISRKNEKAEISDYLSDCKKLSKVSNHVLRKARKLKDSRVLFIEIINEMIGQCVSNQNSKDLLDTVENPSPIKFVVESVWQSAPDAVRWDADKMTTKINDWFEKRKLCRFDRIVPDEDKNEALRLLVVNAMKSLAKIKQNYRDH